MANKESSQKNFFYRLTFGDIIAYDGKQPEELILDQGSQLELSDSTNSYNLLLHGIKVSRKIYQPTEIEAEMDFMQANTSNTYQQATQAPQFDDVSRLLLQRKVTLDVVIDGVASNVVKNCYVYELTPQLQSDTNGTKMYVKLSIFSMDKLMTINKYSKAYVARKLGSEILQPESLNFGILSDGTPLVESDVNNQKHLMYTEGGKSHEFIQPYLVQYNESFYDFLVRTSNRCGEFLYFEDGKLVLGLPDSSLSEAIDNFATVTTQKRSVDPLKISGYARDSVKDGIGAVKGTYDAAQGGNGITYPELNISAIAKEQTGFPKDAFPAHTSINTELAQDDYIFPLYKGMFTNRARELNYDGDAGKKALGRMMLFGKTMLGNELDAVGGAVATAFIEGLINEGIPTMLADLRVSMYNPAQNQRYIEILQGKNDQYNDQKAVQFGTLNSAGWTSLNYYKDILLHEEAQQRKIICINMGTNFINVKLGQKIKIKGLSDTYVVIQIELNSEEAWNRDYDRYGTMADDKYSGMRSLKIYAIPGYDDGKKFIPPVHPVPVIRKVGPQAAFVTDNEDPKFQGRVRIAFPWQSLKGPERQKLQEVEGKIRALEIRVLTLKEELEELLKKATKAKQYIDELKKYVNATKEERKELLQPRYKEIEGLEKDIQELRDSEKLKEAEKLKDSKKNKDSEKPKDSTTSTDIEKKELKIKKIRAEIADFEAAAKEHDEKKGSAGYKVLEADNTVISKYKKIYEKEHKALLKANADEEKAADEKSKKEDESKKLQEWIEKEVNAMATPWVRVVTPMATPGGGTFFRPRVGDEVLVNFENDNVERPYVVGSVFSKNTTTPDEKMYRQRGTELQGKDVSMMMVSPNGHHITFTDPIGGTNFLSNLVSPGLGLWGTIVGGPFTNQLPGAKDLAGGIHIGDRYGLYEIDMKSHKRSIDIRSPFGTVEIDAFSGITISAPNGNVTIRGKNINLEAGNKVNITSGTNIEDPGFGDPEGGAYYAGKLFTDLFAEIIPGELTKYMFASIVDLSYIRHVVEVFVRPVDGTLKLKSKRYLMLEAGKGNATIRRDRYAAAVAEKKETSEEFFQAMLACVKYICEKVDQYYGEYETSWADGYKKRQKYEDIGEANLKDVKNPNLAKLASEQDEWNDNVITEEHYKDCFESLALVYDGEDYVDNFSSKFSAMKTHGDAYGESAFKVYKQIRDFTKMLDEGRPDLGDFDWIAECCPEALKKVDEKCKFTDDWMNAFANGKEDELFKVSEPDPKTDQFAMANKKLFKRKLLLAFVSKVGENPENAKDKYFSCGLRIDEILAKEWIRQEFYWNRTVFFLDRDKRLNRDNYGRKLWDNTFGMIGKKFMKNFTPFDRSIWNDKADGQILFSEEESKTLNFQGEGLHEESSSNIGTLDHLKKELMAIK